MPYTDSHFASGQQLLGFRRERAGPWPDVRQARAPSPQLSAGTTRVYSPIRPASCAEMSHPCKAVPLALANHCPRADMRSLSAPKAHLHNRKAIRFSLAIRMSDAMRYPPRPAFTVKRRNGLRSARMFRTSCRSSVTSSKPPCRD